MRDPVWCHDCGCWSFLDEWGQTPWGVEPDICPVCGSTFPAIADGPMGDLVPSGLTREQAALERACCYA